MKRNEILSEIQKYFDIDELVCDHVYTKWGKQSWQFLDTDFLHVLLIIRRDILKKPMYCNGNSAHQRGLRCNRCKLVRDKSSAYLSSHVLGKAGDFTLPSMTAEQARQIIIQNKDLLPCNIRLEDKVSWLHIDVLPQTGIKDKVYLFQC